MKDLKAWEQAYLAFESPAEEARKFVRRLRAMGAERLKREAEVLELFCGRGSGLTAWRELGFKRVAGLDLSSELLDAFQGSAELIVGDARAIPLPDGSKDVVSVQGGFHHLKNHPDFKVCLAEIHRVLRPGGKLFVVEPWATPFLHLVHRVCAVPAARRASVRIRNLAAMIEEEREEYERWLSSPGEVTSALEEHFEVRFWRARLGKLLFVGERRT